MPPPGGAALDAATPPHVSTRTDSTPRPAETGPPPLSLDRQDGPAAWPQPGLTRDHHLAGQLSAAAAGPHRRCAPAAGTCACASHDMRMS